MLFSAISLHVKCLRRKIKQQKHDLFDGFFSCLSPDDLKIALVFFAISGGISTFATRLLLFKTAKACVQQQAESPIVYCFFRKFSLKHDVEQT